MKEARITNFSKLEEKLNVNDNSITSNSLSQSHYRRVTKKPEIKKQEKKQENTTLFD